MLVLAIETSCDDTCAAVVDDARILSNVISSQVSAHAGFGGVVPEVASRHHLELVNPVVDAALSQAEAELPDVDAIAVTRGPGMIGALLIGVSTAKALAAGQRKPLIAVDHLHGHIAANLLEPDVLEPPFLCLVASGGHTLLAAVDGPAGWDVPGGAVRLGSTLDDAAGEAFDKGARLLGLGFPGGVEIDRNAADGDPAAFDFPVGMSGRGDLDFSFSGLKTALLYRVRELGEAETQERLADLCASYQSAIVAQLIGRLEQALDGSDWPAVALGGGVASNSELRRRAGELCEQRGVQLKLPPPALCTDNAAMIASAARFVEPVAYPGYLDWDAVPTPSRAA